MKDVWLVFSDGDDGEIFATRNEAIERVREMIGDGDDPDNISVYRSSEEYKVRADVELIIKKS